MTAYTPPRCRVGDFLPCERTGEEVQVTGWSDGPIRWPVWRNGTRLSLVLCGDLTRAVREEAADDVMRLFVVCELVVIQWRKALGVPRYTPGGLRRVARRRGTYHGGPRRK